MRKRRGLVFAGMSRKRARPFANFGMAFVQFSGDDRGILVCPVMYDPEPGFSGSAIVFKRCLKPVSCGLMNGLPSFSRISRFFRFFRAIRAIRAIRVIG